jgi:hypothetical protein
MKGVFSHLFAILDQLVVGGLLSSSEVFNVFANHLEGLFISLNDVTSFTRYNSG